MFRYTALPPTALADGQEHKFDSPKAINVGDQVPGRGDWKVTGVGAARHEHPVRRILHTHLAAFVPAKEPTATPLVSTRPLQGITSHRPRRGPAQRRPELAGLLIVLIIVLAVVGAVVVVRKVL